MKRKSISFFLIAFILNIFLFSKFTSLVKAAQCCSNSDCGAQTCGGAGAPCPPNYGTCVSGFEACGPGAPGGGGCPSGECCISNLCSANCGSTCFPAGTKVTLPNKSTKNIEDVKVGEKVLSEDGTGKQSVSTVLQTEQPVSNNICKISYTNNDSLQVTKGQPL